MLEKYLWLNASKEKSNPHIEFGRMIWYNFNTTFLHGDAYCSNLPAQELDIVLERALIHHLNDLNTCFKEAFRLLKKGGTFIIQDRTPGDCLLPGDAHHIRGYFFEKFPWLAEKEIARRHDSGKVQQALEANGFRLAETASFWEIRRAYDDLAQLNEDLLVRTGRSILHELTDAQLKELAAFISGKFTGIPAPIIEKDSWTIWFAIKE